MEKLKYKGEELTLKFGVKALRGIEQETGKKIIELGTTVTGPDQKPSTSFTFDEIIIMLKHGLGNKHTFEECEEILEENDGAFWKVALDCINAFNKVMGVAEAGNSESPQV